MKLIHIGGALAEALIVLLISQIPIVLGILLHPLLTPDGTFTTSLRAVISAISPADAFSYAAGILGSSVGYAIMKISAFKVRPTLMIFLILMPVVVLFFASPVYVLEYNNSLENRELAANYMGAVLAASVFLWIFALYQSRAFFDVQLPSQNEANKIMKDIQG